MVCPLNCGQCGTRAFLPVGDLCDSCAPPDRTARRSQMAAGYGPTSGAESRWLFLEWWAGRGR